MKITNNYNLKIINFKLISQLIYRRDVILVVEISSKL